MPVYSYRCQDCHKISDILTGVSALETEILCEYCGGSRMEKLLSAFSVGTSIKDFASPCQSSSGGHACSGCPHGGSSCSFS